MACIRIDIFLRRLRLLIGRRYSFRGSILERAVSYKGHKNGGMPICNLEQERWQKWLKDCGVGAAGKLAISALLEIACLNQGV